MAANSYIFEGAFGVIEAPRFIVLAGEQAGQGIVLHTELVFHEIRPRPRLASADLKLVTRYARDRNVVFRRTDGTVAVVALACL